MSSLTLNQARRVMDQLEGGALDEFWCQNVAELSVLMGTSISRKVPFRVRYTGDTHAPICIFVVDRVGRDN